MFVKCIFMEILKGMCVDGLFEVILCVIVGVGLQRSLASCYSTASFNSDNEEGKNDKVEDEFDDLLGDKRESRFQGVDPRKGWEFRGVHRVLFIYIKKVFNE